ncbi:DoxX family protein [Comamonas resistens]|uniref:DoxX family protein n=1 Tax=Comamonas resistens TaxID=3046670 RepID=A0ABY8SPW0_9BURK|nr:DoxX family protein [Comamonas resistens]MDL5037544.1 DoxX family protein [Comamonas resistens]WHS64415.1 DoxX family protein [Comamonas resistens]
MKFWNYVHHPRAAMVLLRITLALLMLFHGWAKIRHGIGGIEQMIEARGAPGWLAYAVYLGEVVAPLLLLVGLWVVPAALVIAINMLVAFFLVHTKQVLMLQSSGGWALELQAFFFVTALVVAMGSSRD